MIPILNIDITLQTPLLACPPPYGAPEGGGGVWEEGGQIEPPLEISCDISIVGFSMVGISKMTSIFLYNPPNPLWGGGESPHLKYYVIYQF